MGKVFLMHQRHNDVWYILEKDVDYIGAWHNGKPSIYETDVVYEAEDLPGMLHRMQDQKDWRFYVVLDWIDNEGRKRSTEYPHHRSIQTLAGFIPEVCDIRFDKNPIDKRKEWEIEYCSELWYCRDGLKGDEMIRVRYFTAKMEEAVNELIDCQRLDAASEVHQEMIPT